jgi:hypothetical protein
MTRILGTPDEENWPGVTGLPDYKSTFPQWNAVPLTSAIRGLDEVGLDLLAQMLIYDPAHRMSGTSLSCLQAWVRKTDDDSKTSTSTSLFQGNGMIASPSPSSYLLFILIHVCSNIDNFIILLLGHWISQR